MSELVDKLDIFIEYLEIFLFVNKYTVTDIPGAPVGKIIYIDRPTSSRLKTMGWTSVGALTLVVGYLVYDALEFQDRVTQG